jgi:hypothetical protein
MVAPRDQLASLYQTFWDEHASEDPSKLVALKAGGWEARFDSKDILRWALKSGIGKIKQCLMLGRCRWIPDPGPVQKVNDHCRIAVLGDWGTGLYGAPECARHVQGDGEFELLLHLGDIYYTGTERAITERFRPWWPTVKGATTRCLNGNHEMYAGGAPYFSLISGYGQPASFFALQNDHWLLAGLDTAYTDHELHGEQVKWLGELLAKAGDRRLILFSHHYPFSLFDAPAQRLISQLSPLLDARKVFAWYWGHEHLCAIFDRHEQWKMYGRCVGHAGMPELRTDSVNPANKRRTDFLLPQPLPTTPTFIRVPGTGMLTPGGAMLHGPNAFVAGHEKEYLPHGYLVLELDGPTIIEEYRAPNGDPLERVTLS